MACSFAHSADPWDKIQKATQSCQIPYHICSSDVPFVVDDADLMKYLTTQGRIEYRLVEEEDFQ